MASKKNGAATPPKIAQLQARGRQQLDAIYRLEHAGAAWATCLRRQISDLAKQYRTVQATLFGLVESVEHTMFQARQPWTICVTH